MNQLAQARIHVQIILRGVRLVMGISQLCRANLSLTFRARKARTFDQLLDIYEGDLSYRNV